MAYPVMPLGFLGSQGDQDTYRIERSLRFNSTDSTYLSRTAAVATNQQVITLSFWVKRSVLGSRQALFSWAGASTANNHSIEFTASDTINIYSVGTAASLNLNSSQVFRDSSSWYHIVFSIDTTQATASNRLRLYVNGGEVLLFGTATYPSQNASLQINSANAINIGRRVDNSGAGFFNGYLTEINFVDGQALTPSSFGETDPNTGRWIAKAYGQIHVANGFHLNFADDSGATATTLGKDSSPNGNNWTPNNFSVTAGAGNDSLVDSPTNYGTDRGVGGEVSGNYCTLNPIDRNTTATLSNGNLDFATATSGHNAIGTIGVSSGKWYWEAQTSAGTTEARATVFGTAASSYYSFAANNTAYGFRFDAGAGTLEYTTNGSTWTSLATGLTSGPYFPFFNNNGTTSKTISINFGQRPFAYTAPSGFKALCTTNLPLPAIKNPSTAMGVVTYTGNGSARSITGLGFSPDLVWIKSRSGATDHAIYDSVRGVGLDMASNLSSVETTQSQGLTAFNSDGFDIGTLAKINTNSDTYVAWAWDESSRAGMDFVSYTGNGAQRTIAHNLGIDPKMIIIKGRDSSQSWQIYHHGIGLNGVLAFSTAGIGFTLAHWPSSPTSSEFSIGTSSAINSNNIQYIAYLFAEVVGFSRIGSYTGNGSANGPFVFTGHRPRFLLVKRTDAAGQNWVIFDTARKTINDANRTVLFAESNGIETTDANPTDILSNGFKIRNIGTGVNASGGQYVYASFAESPFKYARAR